MTPMFPKPPKQLAKVANWRISQQQGSGIDKDRAYPQLCPRAKMPY
jgi:hypothetical protein